MMTLNKILIIIPIFYLLALIQGSFFLGLKTGWLFPNLILVIALSTAFLEKEKYSATVSAALFGGFFWDVFSEEFFGYHVILLLAASLFIRQIIRKYVYSL